MSLAEFKFSPKPIVNITAKKKALKAFNTKMGRLAASGDMVSPDSNLRRTALANASKIKERMRNL